MSSSNILCFTGILVLPDCTLNDGVVVCRSGKIAAVGPQCDIAVPPDATIIETGEGYIAPGFVDLHVHGGNGADFMDGDAAAVGQVTRAHARHGTTTLFPTTTTGSKEQIAAMLQACETAQHDPAGTHGARIAGVHLYGPFFAENKVGCHAQDGRRDPDPGEYLEYFSSGLIRIATCAAELPGAEAFYQEAARRRCFVTCGHSDASWTEMDLAFRAGMRHVDHFWCAMSSVPSVKKRFGTPLQGSMEQFVLRQTEMSTEVIADGFHLAPELLEFAYIMKGPRRLCLVTDSSRALDQPPGRYRFGPQPDGEWFESDGRVGVNPGGGLASSVTGMDAMVRNMLATTSAGIVDTVRMASLTPAERTGIATDCGSLEVGKRADVLVLSKELEVKNVFIGGIELPMQTGSS